MSELIKAQYGILAELKKVDEKIFRFQLDINRIPEEIAKLEQTLSTRRQQFEKDKSTFDTQEKALRKLEQDLKAKEDSLNKAESKLMDVKTNEEYQAALKENQGQKVEKSSLEDQVLKLITDLEGGRSKVQEAEKEYKGFEATIKADIDRLNQERMQLVNLMEEQIQKRDQTSAQLDKSVAEIYEKVRARKKGAVPIVYVQNGTCLGCNIQVRPQLFNEVLGYKAIHLCGGCSRILVIPPQNSGAEAS